MTKPLPLIVYLHGFNSSPASTKAQQFKQWIDSHPGLADYWIPELPIEAEEVVKLLQARLMAEIMIRPIHIVGSSMGGFMGTWLQSRLQEINAENTGRLAIINPAVRPWELLRDYLGPQANYHTGEQYELKEEHAEQLKPLEVEALNKPKDIMVLLQKGDEVLDYRKAEAKYKDCHLIIQEGGDHSFQGSREIIPEIISFFQLLQ
ncbi:YqiA/YcfP family alpha/beta fold hydrolase [Endozoicomonadaceae bacterium StTr2]